MQVKQEMHITLWHGDDPVAGPDLGLQQALLDVEGNEVAFEVTHIDYKPNGMAAAKVQVGVRHVRGVWRATKWLLWSHTLSTKPTAWLPPKCRWV